jgi:hypothetical protein
MKRVRVTKKELVKKGRVGGTALTSVPNEYDFGLTLAGSSEDTDVVFYKDDIFMILVPQDLYSSAPKAWLTEPEKVSRIQGGLLPAAVEFLGMKWNPIKGGYNR